MVRGYRYYCEAKCGFEGRFDEVALHETTCPAMRRALSIRARGRAGALASVRGARGGLSASSAASACESARVVVRVGVRVVWERGTARLPALLRLPQASEMGYECQHRCGFSGSFHEVAVHEASCQARRRRRAPQGRTRVVLCTMPGGGRWAVWDGCE